MRDPRRLRRFHGCYEVAGAYVGDGGEGVDEGCDHSVGGLRVGVLDWVEGGEGIKGESGHAAREGYAWGGGGS